MKIEIDPVVALIILIGFIAWLYYRHKGRAEALVWTDYRNHTYSIPGLEGIPISRN